MAFVPLVALGTLVYMFVNFLRYLANHDLKSVTTQLIAWAAGVAGVFIMAQTPFAAGIPIGDQNLATLNSWSLVLVGLMATSLLSGFNDFKKALDNKQSAAVPTWPEPSELFKRRKAAAGTSAQLPAAQAPSAPGIPTGVPSEWVEEVRHTIK